MDHYRENLLRSENIIEGQNEMSLSREAKGFLFCQFLYRFGLFFSRIFLVIFLWKGHQSLEQLAIFFLVQSIVIVVVYYPCGIFARYTSPITAFRTGVSLYGVSYGALLYFHDFTDELTIWVALGTGIAESFWSVGTHIITMDLVVNKVRDAYSHYENVLVSISGMVAPFLAGIMITYIGGLQGYFAIFLISALFFASSVIFSSFLPKKSYDKQTHMKKVFRHRSPEWGNLLKASFFWGGAEGLFKNFLLVMVLYFIVQSEGWIGTLTMFSNCVSVVFSLIYAKQIHPENRHQYYLFSAINLLIFSSILMISPDFWVLLILLIIVGITTPALDIPMNTVMYEVVDSVSNSSSERLDFITVREIPLGLGRMISLLFFIFLHSIWLTEAFIYISLIIFSAMYLLNYIWIGKQKST